MTYEFDMGAGFLSKLVYIDAGGEVQLNITLLKYESACHPGEYFFVRGSDIFELSAPQDDSNVSNFAIGQHKKYGAWDQLIYHLSVDARCTAAGAVANSTLRCVWGGRQQLHSWCPVVAVAVPRDCCVDPCADRCLCCFRSRGRWCLVARGAGDICGSDV